MARKTRQFSETKNNGGKRVTLKRTKDRKIEGKTVNFLTKIRRGGRLEEGKIR